MGATVTDAQVAAYRPLVESVADRLHRPGRYIWRDDLVQEGLIAVWNVLQKGQKPNEKDVERRMVDWIRTERKRGFTNVTRGEDVDLTDMESAGDSVAAP